MGPTERIDRSRAMICKLGRIASVLFTVLLVAFLLLVVYVVWYAINYYVDIEGLGIVNLANGGRVVIPFGCCIVATTVVTLSILRDISADIARDVSPFTSSHSSKIFALGVLFAISAVFPLFYPHQFVDLTVGMLEICIAPNAFMLDFGGGMAIDVQAIVLSLVCIVASAIWRYGSFLQVQSDDLV